MGCTGAHYEKGMGMKEFFRRELECENNRGKWEVLDVAVRPGVAFVALKVTNKRTGKADVIALACSFRWRRDYYNLLYRDDNEASEPYRADCPERILDLLTPTDNESALRWRRRAREWNYERSKAARRSKGISPLLFGC